MGGSASNIAGGSAEEKGGSPPKKIPGNVNVLVESRSPEADLAHGAEKKGSGEAGTDKKSVIGS